MANIFEHLAPTMRQRLVHGHWSEYAVHFLSIASNAAFVVGSACFFSGVPEDVARAGPRLFLVGALVMAALSAFGLWENAAHFDRLKLVVEAQEHHQSARGLKAPDDDLEQGDATPVQDRRGVPLSSALEDACYVVGGLCFVAGSVLYDHGLPSITRETDEDIQAFHKWGAACFIVGSAFYFLAAYFNSLNMAKDGRFMRCGPASDAAFDCRSRGLLELALFSVQFGSMVFFAGSFLYQPALACCSTGMRPKRAIDQGSLLYVVGSAFYLLQSLVALAMTLRRHGDEHKTLVCTIRHTTEAGERTTTAYHTM
ncbi:hypothetical protein M885DRAFT_581185 [Pelagophyceae sp. CCMP2097]|nr:hypothetical protein M885DRAFT_581185 [Pelagophyceae sp. CCMP2097]